MKKAKIAVDHYESEEVKNTTEELGLDAEDLASIKSKLLGVEETEEEKLGYIRLYKAMPYSIVPAGEEKNGRPPVVSLLIMCMDKATKDPFIMFHNYIVETDEDMELIKNNPLYIYNQPYTNVAMFQSFLNFRKFNTDLDMYTITEDDKDANFGDKFYTTAYIKEEEPHMVKMYMDYNLANILMYTDDFICSGEWGDLAEEDLYNTIFQEDVMCYRVTQHMFVKDEDIHSVTYLSIRDKKEKIYDVVFKINNPESKTETDQYFNISISIHIDEHVKPNISTKELVKIMSKDNDRYNTIFTYNGMINDKEYTVLKAAPANAKDKTAIELFFDIDSMTKLDTMVVDTFKK